MSDTIFTSLESRPVRLGIFVSPDDRAGLLDAMELCTCVWGGIRNPILPLVTKVSRLFREPNGDQPSAETVFSGFLEVFEPDVLVTPNPTDLPDWAAVRRQPTARLGDLLKQARDGDPAFGVSMTELYRHLYQEEYRFVRKHPTNVLRPVVSDPSLEMLTASRWGRLPSADTCPSFNRMFDDVFDPIRLEWKPDPFKNPDKSPRSSPLSLTLSELQGWWGRNPSVLLIDHENPLDIMAAWSLRAYGSHVLAVPIQWANEMKEVVQGLIEAEHEEPDEQRRGGNWVFIRRAAGVSHRALKSFVDGLAVQTPAIRAIDRYFPALWSQAKIVHDLYRGCGRFVADHSDIDVAVRDNCISITPLCPKFLDRQRVSHRTAWVNRVSLGTRYGGNGGSLVLPKGTQRIDELLRSWGSFEESPRQVREGIATICRNTANIRWGIPAGQDVVKWWLKQRGWSASPSGAGLIASRLIHALGGHYGISTIGHKGIVALLDRFTGKHQRLVKSREELLTDIEDSLKRSHQRFGPDASRVFEILVEQGVLRVGLELQCPVCRQRNWYPLGSIQTDLGCERCLARFPFPIGNPPSDGWRYRPVGPFAIENYAHGAYAVALALRFFLLTLHGESSWSTGLELKRLKPDGEIDHLEVDAALFWTQRFRGHGQVLFLEAKSFETPIASADIERAKQIMAAFPEAIFVFATMADMLSKGEKSRIREFVKDLPNHQWDRFQDFKPVLILTGVELFSSDQPPNCWKAAGPPWSVFGERERNSYELGELCDASQRLHLAESTIKTSG